MVEGSVGTFGWANSDCRELQLRDGVSGDGGGDWGLLPHPVGAVDQINGRTEAAQHNENPKDPGCL